jgi:hypothetical protein
MTTVNEAARNLVFVSYSHRDAVWLERLKTHLKPLERQGLIEVWDDQRIGAGERWRDEIRSALARARVAVLLVSPDFLASDFIAQHELPVLLDAEKGLRSRVVWIPVRPSNHEATELGEYQAAFDPRRALAEMDEAEADRALVAVSKQILEVYREVPSREVRSVAGRGQRVAASGQSRFAVVLAGVALAAAVAWLAAHRPLEVVPAARSERPEAGEPMPPPPSGATVINGDVVQNVEGPGATGVIGNQVNVGSQPERK